MTQHPGVHTADTVVQECVGYRATFNSFFWHMLLLPGCAAAPQLVAKLLVPCDLQYAEYVLCKLADGRYFLLGATVIPLKADQSVLSKTWGRNVAGNDCWHVRTFELFKRVYMYSPGPATFQPVPPMPSHLPRQIRRALETLHLVNTAGVDWGTFNASQKQARKDMVPLYGTKRPLLKGHVGLGAAQQTFAPIFMLQMVEVVYLIYMGRYFYPAIILALFLGAGILLVVTTRHQRKKMLALVNECRLTPLVWQGWVRAMSSHRLLPGDVLVLQPGKALCDMVVLQGSCLVVESMLSGEASQLRKSNYVPEKGVDYDPDKANSCTVYAGTIVQQVWNAQDPQDEVLVMVVRTGLNTTMGSLVRELLAPSKRAAGQDPFVTDTFVLYAFALCLQLLIHIPYFLKASAFQHTAADVAFKLLDMLVLAAPVGAPTILLLIIGIGYMRLAKDRINLLIPEALKVGALTDVVCFDKTGTLTHTAAELHGVMPVHKGEFQVLQKSALQWGNRLKQAVAVCNSLNMVNKTTVGGNDMERAMFKAVEARFLDREHVVLPRRPDQVSTAWMAKLSIAKVIEFTSQTLRSGVVVWADDGPEGAALFFLRGAPAVIRDLVQPSTVPDNFSQVIDDYSSKSFRLLALAMGIIPNAGRLDLAGMTQQQVEAHATHMQLLSLVVLTNNVRPDSKDTISHLQEGGGLRTLMITGDYHHTAVAIARDVGMVKPDSQIVIIDTMHKDPVRQAASALQPEMSDSEVASAAPTPQVSFRQRSADYAHGFFGLSRGTSKLWNPDSGAEMVSRSLASRNASLLQAEEEQTSDMAPGHKVSFEVPKPSRLSFAMGSVNGKQLPFQAESVATAELPVKAAVANRLPVDAVSMELPTTIRLSDGSLPVEAAQSGRLLPFYMPLPGSQSKRMLVRAHSLTRLPSEAAASITNSLAESPDDDSSSRNKQQSSTRSLDQQILEHSQCSVPASMARILHPRQRHTWDSPLACDVHSVSGLRGLTCTSGVDKHHMDPREVFTAMIAGSLQCAVTGDAFEHLLQLHDMSLLDTVVRNAVVFSRMQPGQKGQVMDLLGSRGVHQVFEGQPRHIQGLGNTTVFCGDGVNDLAALAAADVGMSIGATDAVIAAAVSTPQGSVAGVCTLIRTGKALHAMTISLFKYMVVYEAILGQVNCAAFFVDGSSISNLQSGAIDVQAMCMALAACLAPPLARLNWHKPSERICTTSGLARIAAMAVGLQVLDVSYMLLLCSRPWFKGGTGDAYLNPVVTLAWYFGNLQLLAPLISLTIDTKPFCVSPLHTKPLMVLSVICTTCAYVAILTRSGSFNPLNFFNFSQSFRLQYGAQCLGGIVVYTVYMTLFRHLIFWHGRRRLYPT